MTHKLISAGDLAGKFGLSGQAVGAVLLRDGVQPAYVSRDKKTMLYDTEAAAVVVQKYVDSKRPPAPMGTPPAPAAQPAQPTASEISAAVTAAAAGVVSELLGDFMTELKELDAASRERDRQVFKAVEAVHALVSRLAPYPVESKPGPVAAPAPEPPEVLKTTKPTPQRRVLIIGLLSAQVEMIRKEFGECFRLSFVASDETKGHGFDAQLSGADHVIMMTAFCNHGLERVLKRKDKDLRRISGGMSSLRHALTELFVFAAEAAK